MEILGIGPSELVFIILLAILVLGPKDMQKAGRTLGRWMNQINRSELWKLVNNTTREISNMPRKWMREANLEEWEADQAKNLIDPRTSRRQISSLSKPIDLQGTSKPAPEPSISPTAEEKQSTDQHG